MNKSATVVGLDIGTTKVCAVIGEITETGQVDVVGIGTSKSLGMRKGVVINIDQTAQAIRQAVEDAETMAGQDIDTVYVGIAGSHIMSIDSDGLVHVSNGTVTQKDINRALEAASFISMPSDRQVIHILPQEFIVDDQRGIIDPLGMSAVHLKVLVHIVTGAVSSAQNIIRSCHRSDLNVADLTLESLASSRAVLTQEEKEIGVALVDCGGGTTDIALFANNTIKYTAGVPAGGSNVSHDIAYGLKTSLAAAEKLKIKYGCALQDMVPENENIEVPSVGGREPRILSRRELAYICEARMAEIFNHVNEEINRSNYAPYLGAGIVLTGGASLIEGCVELADQIFYPLSTRIGYPKDIGGLKDVVNSPKFSTAVGLLLTGAELEASGKRKYLGGNDAAIRKSIWEKMKEWFKDIS